MRYLRSRPLDRPTIRMPALRQHALQEACRQVPDAPRAEGRPPLSGVGFGAKPRVEERPTLRMLPAETERLVEESRGKSKAIKFPDAET